MLDENSLIVTYKDWRGEPRGKHRKKAGAEQLGDCIDCNACVAVCPTGVDIREGQQIGCITCALCIDACDEIMAKVGKPRGLIDYCTLRDAERERAGHEPAPVWRRALRPRTILYFTLWSAIGVAMLISLALRDTIAMTVAHDRNPVYVTLSDGGIRNAYTVKVENKNPMPHDFRLTAESGLPLAVEIQGAEGATFEVAADESRTVRVFLSTEPGAVPERSEVRLVVEDLETGETTSYMTHFQGPEQ